MKIGAARVVWAAIGVGILAPSGLDAQRHTGAAAPDAPVFVLPDRKPAAGPVDMPSALPDEAETIAPSTIELETTGGGLALTVHTVTRTADRMHIRIDADREWLYLRNPTDPRRVSALFVEHSSKAIVHYEDSELRNTLGIPGWLDVLALGFDPTALEQMTRTADVRTAFGLTFRRYAASRSDHPVADAWWSTDELLPLSVTSRSSSRAQPMSVTIRQIRSDVDRRLLESPANRFPQYRQVDLPDWLEGLHER